MSLLPCPFCGGEAELKHYQSGDWQVICYHADGCIMCESDLDNCYWENVQTLARQWNSRAERTCTYAVKDNMNETEGMGDVWFECSACNCKFDYYADEWLMKMSYCPNCGKAVKR